MNQIHVWQTGMKPGLFEQAIPKFPKAEIAGRDANKLFGRNKFRPGAKIGNGVVAGEDSLARIGSVPFVGYVAIRQTSDTQDCLSVTGGSIINGATTHLWACSGKSNQSWKLVPIS